MILERLRRAEHREDGVAERNAIDLAAVALRGRLHDGRERSEHLLHVLGIVRVILDDLRSTP
ncbi:MAG: hypothetical protein QM736_05255 [Vicinamibacterales bacterium]